LTVNRQRFGFNCPDGDETLAHWVTSPSARGQGEAVLNRARRIASGQSDGPQMSGAVRRPARRIASGQSDGPQMSGAVRRPARQTGVLPGGGNLTGHAHCVPALGPWARWHFEWGRANAPASPVRPAAAK